MCAFHFQPIFYMFFSFVFFNSQPLTHSKEYCWEPFNATCADDEVIVMQSAHYGRMKFGRCLPRDYYIGCVANILPQIERKCSGRRSCLIEIPDTDMHKMQPCPKDLMAYLDATYTCVKVAYSEADSCKPRQYSALPREGVTGDSSSTSGYISNLVTEETNQGSPTCPWLITVPPGQRINVTLLDFASLGVAGRGAAGDSNVCMMYAVIRETLTTGASSTDVTVCGGERREKGIYLSERNRLVIEVMSTNQLRERPYFLIKYDAVGCRDLKAPANGWLERQGDRATVSCNYTTDVWHLVCSGDTWIGSYKNCSSTVSAMTEGMDSPKIQEHSFPFGVFMAIVIGIALGVFMGLLLLSTVICCRKGKRNQFCKYSPKDPDIDRWTNNQLDDDATANFEQVDKLRHVMLSATAADTSSIYNRVRSDTGRSSCQGLCECNNVRGTLGVVSGGVVIGSTPQQRFCSSPCARRRAELDSSADVYSHGGEQDLFCSGVGGIRAPTSLLCPADRCFAPPPYLSVGGTSLFMMERGRQQQQQQKAQQQVQQLDNDDDVTKRCCQETVVDDAYYGLDKEHA